MERNVRYQILSTEEDSPSQSVAMTTIIATTPSASYIVEPGTSSSVPSITPAPPAAPPEYAASDAAWSDEGGAGEPPKGAYLPPDYDVATDLPTYEEVQRLKLEEEQRRDDVRDVESLHRDDNLLGTDFIFFCSFFVAFLFNWIGFLLLMCFCHTIAGRYGALAGFGLSLAKWTLIVKHSTDLISADNSWLWWLILAFGVLICVRAILQYVHVKREWRLLTHSAQERLMYFY